MTLRNSLILFILLAIASPMMAAEVELGDDDGPTEREIQFPPAISDEAIDQRLKMIFAEINALEKINVSVSNGVVKLSGVVPNIQAIDDAVVLTEKMNGVVYVINDLETSTEVSKRLSPAVAKTEELIRSGIQQLPILAIAILIVVIFWIIGSWLSRRKTWLKWLGLNELSASLVQRFLKLVAIGLGVFIALEILDATALAGAVIGVAGVVGIALGFAFRNIVENYLAGILLSVRNPFSTGDAVEIEGVTGKVIRLTSRDTVLMTFDGNHLRIPNSKIITSSLTNFSRNPLRRFDFAIGVAVELNLMEVRKLGLSTLQSLSSILEDPKPMIIIEELGDSTVNMRFFAWIDQRESDYLKSKSEAIRLVKDAFDDAGIEMPEPIYRVHLRNAGSLALSNVPEKAPTQFKDKTSSQQNEGDTAADHSIDEQLRTAHQVEDEPNLLEK